MSTAQHSQGRLCITKNKHGASGYVVAIVATERGDRSLLIEATDGDDSQDEANARRLAACWNACEGMSTEWLEGRADAMRPDTMPLDHALETAIGERDVLWRQRDELLAALEDIYRELAWDQLPPAKRYLADNARAAIAKVKGGAA